ncbi:MAG: hypothetical protein U0802_15030 [Candidatus Binatia bacterium]
MPDRLRRMFAARTDHVIFFDAADDVPFATAMQAMDAAREGGAVTIATLTRACPTPPAAPDTARAGGRRRRSLACAGRSSTCSAPCVAPGAG